MICLAIESSNHRGMGHLFRSFLVVEYMEEHAIDYVYLINNDEKSLGVLRERNIKYVIVDYNDEESDWEKKIIDQYGISTWINDKFETSINMAKHIKSTGVYLALIDDIGAGEVYADVNYVGLIYFTKQRFISKNTRIGMQYVILNSEIDMHRHLREKFNRLIVSFGGSDPNNNTLSVVKRLLKTDIPFDITVGPNNRSYDELESLRGNRFELFQNVPSLIELFAGYDLAITGGGVTCCEANAAGLPCIIIANVPHEVNTGKFLEKCGGCIYAGSYEEWDVSIIDRVRELQLKEMSRKGMNAFDTHALERIFSDLLSKGELM